MGDPKTEQNLGNEALGMINRLRRKAHTAEVKDRNQAEADKFRRSADELEASLRGTPPKRTPSSE